MRRRSKTGRSKAGQSKDSYPKAKRVEHNRVRSCAHKRNYPSFEAAERIMQEIKNRNAAAGTDKGNKWMHVYECELCQKFHIGHKPRALREQEREENNREQQS